MKSMKTLLRLIDAISLSAVATSSVVACTSQLKFTELTNTGINNRINSLLNVNGTIYAAVESNERYHDKLYKSLG